VFAFSSLSSHTPDLRSDSRASLTVTARGYQARSALSSHATRTSWAQFAVMSVGQVGG
jgi:aminoglycoside phosphotransferase